MNRFHMIAGLPRAGSTLLCNLLNSNPNFHSTPTSGVIDTLRTMRSNISHDVTWKAQNRLRLLENIRMGLKGFLEGFYYDKNVVFDKCRGWTSQFRLLDEILGHKETKMIWTYRNPVDVVSSIEEKYRKTILLENTDESQNAFAFSTMERRINTFIADGGIVSNPVWLLNDAVEQGYLDRILFVKYEDITMDPQSVMRQIHNFLGEEPFTYDIDNVKQTTFEFDGFYNYKFPHTIKEGKIEYKHREVDIPQKYVDQINHRFSWLNQLVLGPTGEQPTATMEPMDPPKDPQKEDNNDNNIFNFGDLTIK